MSSSNQPYPEVNPRQSFPKLEEEVQKHWKSSGTFERSVAQRSPGNQFVFYDGPPFATGLPHYGHLLQGTVKDVIPRYKTMRGYRVERRFGWDCHGLPIELEIEQELGLSGAPDILEYGVRAYNEKCRATVQRYTKEWRVTTERMGRWIDFENDYKTMDKDFMESVWSVFQALWNKGLVYEGKKVLPYSWRLSTPLSNSEASLNYMDTQDPSVTVCFRLREKPGTSLLVWTTTPWTLPSNLAVCVGPKLEYVEIRGLETESNYILGASRVETLFKEGQYEVLRRFQGEELKGLSYEPLFDFAKERVDTSSCFQILLDDYVSDDSGTGLVHQAPAFGEDDLRICTAHGIPVFDPLDRQGSFLPDLPLIGGLNFKDADKTISKALKEKGLMFRQETLNHSYPFCWRTDTPLMYRALSSWFVSIDKIKALLLENAKEINWVPSHIKDGRFGNWLENARDWAISRNRFWGTPLPVWRSESGDQICFGSVKELEKACGRTIEDIHKHFVDEIVLTVGDQTYYRVPEVLDCWFESGSMPYGQQHYPFENRAEFEANFPADFICEAVDQTRCWFYYLHVIGTALMQKKAFSNVICTGLILASDGKKLSKRHKNYTPPQEVFDTYGADAMRYFLVTSPVVKGLEVRIADSEFKEVVKSVILPLWNVYSFFTSYANIDGYRATGNVEPRGLLDRYILSEYSLLLQNVTRELDRYELAEAARHIQRFIPILTNWYVRRSRRRFWAEGLQDDKIEAYETLYVVLTGLCKILAPIMPYVTEAIYCGLSGEESVHLVDWEEVCEDWMDQELCDRMNAARTIVNLGHSLRTRNRMKVRRPLRKIRIGGSLPDGLLADFSELICDELNVKDVEFVNDAASLGRAELKLNFKLLGRKLGKSMQSVARAARNGEFQFEGDEVVIEGHRLQSTEFEVLYQAEEGYDCASESGVVAALDLEIDKALEIEGYARDAIRHLQNLRKQAGLELTERIQAWISFQGVDPFRVEQDFGSLIAGETLSEALHFDSLPKHLLSQHSVDLDDDVRLEVGLKRRN